MLFCNGNPNLLKVTILVALPPLDINAAVVLIASIPYRIAGKHEGTVVCKSDDSLMLNLKWGSPYGGVGTDVFTMPHDDELHVVSNISLEGASATYKTIYNRKK